MSDEAKKPDHLKLVQPPDDAPDLSDLWLDTTPGDALTGISHHEIPVGKPRDFFRIPPDLQWRRKVEVYTHKAEGAVDEQNFIVHKNMWGKIAEARPALLVTCIYRDGSLRLWPLKGPRSGEKENDAWISARHAARIAQTKWVKIVWVRRAYQVREAMKGYAPDPDWNALPTFDKLVALAFGAQGVISDTSHFIYREIMGAPVNEKDAGDDDEAGDL